YIINANLSKQLGLLLLSVFYPFLIEVGKLFYIVDKEVDSGLVIITDQN
ncbi:4167_t:CDS:1, partial [Rhizophagus irregularis]